MDLIFIISSFFGQGLRYNKIYFFHVCFIIFSLWTLRNISKKIPRIKNFPEPLILISMALILVWSSLSIIWSPNLSLWAQRYAQIILCFSIPFLLVLNSESLEGEKKRFKVFISMVCFHVLVCYLEIFEIIRWPFGKFLPEAHSSEMMATNAPNSFFWNQNNCAFVTLLILPLLEKLPFRFRIIIHALALPIIYMSGSKIILVGFFLYTGWFVFFGWKLRWQFKLGFLISLVLGGLFLKTLDTSSHRLGKYSNIHQSIIEYSGVVEHCVDNDLSGIENLTVRSMRQRILMMCGATQVISQHPILGGGLFQNSVKDFEYHSTPYSLDTIHHFWLEIWMDQGLIGLMLFGAWILLSLRFFHRQGLRGFRDCIVLFVIFVPVIPTAYYFLFIYLVMGLGYSLGSIFENGGREL